MPAIIDPSHSHRQRICELACHYAPIIFAERKEYTEAPLGGGAIMQIHTPESAAQLALQLAIHVVAVCDQWFSDTSPKKE